MRFCIVFLILSLCACVPARQQGYPNTANSSKYSQKQPPIKRYTKEDKDGAPKGPLPTFFQKLLPKNEPLSRYGNPSSYRVDGHQYQILKTAHGYKSRGLASWYGTKFHSQRTSSGENYDMYAMTAAHCTLPLPSYIRVKNLDNGRVAIVKVNDRGPFHSNRLIDLSYAAATKLGILPKGTAHVEIEALAEKNAKIRPAAKYYLQAGAFQSQPLADALQKRLRQWTHSPIRKEKYHGKYIVRVGPLANQHAMVALKRQLERHGVHGAFSFLQ